MSLGVKLNNLYVDREITGEIFLQSYKVSSQFIHNILPEDTCLAQTARLACQVALFLFLSPLIVIGMITKCLNVSQIRSYNEKIRQKLTGREILTDYPDQPDTVYRHRIDTILSELTQANVLWERRACNIIQYAGDNEVFVQFIEKNPRWHIPESGMRPFTS